MEKVVQSIGLGILYWTWSGNPKQYSI